MTKVHQNEATLNALNSAAKNFTLAFFVFFKYCLALRFAKPLDNNLLRGLRGHAAIFGRRKKLCFYFVADSGLRMLLHVLCDKDLAFGIDFLFSFRRALNNCFNIKNAR